MVSEWNQWLVPAPMTIIERPPDSSALAANSRAMRAARSASTPVIADCQAGVYGSSASSYDVGQRPGSPGRPTPYWASSRSYTVVTGRPAIRRTGTPRRSRPAPPSGASKRGSRTVTGASPPPSADSSGSVSPRSRFHLPAPPSPNRSPRVPLGTTGLPSASSSTVRNAGCSARAWVPPRSAAVRNFPGAYVPGSPATSSRATRNGRSVKRLT